MWEIREGYTKFLYVKKLVPSKDLVPFILTLFIENIILGSTIPLKVSLALFILTLFMNKHVFAHNFLIAVQVF